MKLEDGKRTTKFKVTYYSPRKSQTARWIKLVFFTRPLDDANYYPGFETSPAYSREDMEILVHAGHVKRLEWERDIQPGQALWLAPDNEILLASETDPLGDPLKFVIERGPESKANRIFRTHISDQFLQYLGISSDVLENEELPGEIHDSLAALQTLIEGDKKFLDVVKSSSYLEVQIQYSHLGVIQRLQNNLSALLSELEIGTKKPYPSQPGRFDFLLNSSLTRGVPAICIFPFFCAPRRRSEWGVIPYAKHRLLGLLIHENHPSLKSWNELKDKYPLRPATENKLMAVGKGFNASSVIPDFGQSIPTVESLNWIIQLIKESASLPEGKIFSFAGFIYDEILVEMARMAGKEKSRLRLIDILWPGFDFSRRQELPMLQSTTPPPYVREDRKGSILLFDPGDVEWMRTVKASDYEIVLIQHGCTIPVGIGFSLTALPMVLDKENWRQLYKAAVSVLAPHNEELMGIGIELEITVKEPATIVPDVDEAIS